MTDLKYDANGLIPFALSVNFRKNSLRQNKGNIIITKYANI